MEDEIENDYEIETTEEEDITVDEPVQQEQEVNPLMDMVNAIGDGDFSKAGDLFGAELNNRLSDTIEQERISVASNIYAGKEE
tara:strand:- start:10309 stop:10557 length:249 start_codon:yes stop_codon:yes gene_type:complete